MATQETQATATSSSTQNVGSPMDTSGSTLPVAGPSTINGPMDEAAKKDRALADFMLMLDDYEPLIPNEVTDYYLQRVGFESDDVRLKRLLSLAAQKFVSDIAAEAFQHARLRTNATTGGRAKGDKNAPGGNSAVAKDKSRTVLTLDDLSSALQEYGLSSKKPDYYL
ncbi:transcription initiation factor IID TAF10 subunit [Clavulina sp. PMI_390]|nr:transcription initiation factor IID TAF10 subunit [Clavulina sp. PMI_390]